MQSTTATLPPLPARRCTEVKKGPIRARGFVAAIALGLLLSGVAVAQTTPPYQSQIQGVPGIQMPSPQPQPTISGTPLPYPAYGTPAPDVEALKPKTGVPQSISLNDAIRIAVALSPTFALQNAQWAAIHARYTSSVQALYPGLSANAQMGKSYSNGNSTSTFNTSSPISTPTPLAPLVSATNGVGSYSASTIATESANITITQLIYDGGRTIANIRSALDDDSAFPSGRLRAVLNLRFDGLRRRILYRLRPQILHAAIGRHGFG